MTKVPVTISIEQDTITQVDRSRGQVPRSRVLEDAIDLGMRHFMKESTPTRKKT
jgi:hypothetical protein